MTPNEYQQSAARTMPHVSDDDLKLHALHGMCGEVGEIHSLFQKVYQGHEFDETHLKKEIGDLLWFVAELCTVYHFKLEDIMQMNIDKLLKRYSTDAGFTVEESLHRDKNDI